MVGGGGGEWRHHLPEMLVQTDPAGAKTPLFKFLFFFCFFAFLVDAFVCVFNCIVLSCCHYGVIKHEEDDDDDDDILS